MCTGYRKIYLSIQEEEVAKSSLLTDVVRERVDKPLTEHNEHHTTRRISGLHQASHSCRAFVSRTSLWNGTEHTNI